LFGLVFSTAPVFKDGVSVGNLPSNAQWQEVSGMTGSTIAANANYLWAQSDGAEAKILAILKTNAATTYEWTLDGVTVNDCEDMANAKINDTSYLYVAQIGDNANAHATSTIYRFPEPIINGSTGAIASETIEHIIVEFPADHMPTHKDAETFLVDPDTGDMYIITKREEIPSVYHLAHQASYTGTQTLVYDGNMWAIPAKTSVAAAGAAPNAVGGNISPDGTEIIIKNYDQVFYWDRSDKGVSIYETLTQTPTELVAYVGGGSNTPRKSHPSAEPQGEAITWDYNGENFYTGGEYVASEGSTPTQYPLFMYERMYDTETTVYFQDGNNGYSGTLDTYIWDTNPDTSYGTLTTLVADTDTNYVETNQRKVLLKFDISSIPSTATITGATLYLYVNTEGQWFRFQVI